MGVMLCPAVLRRDFVVQEARQLCVEQVGVVEVAGVASLYPGASGQSRRTVK